MSKTPEGAVKDAVHKLLHSKGFIRAGTAKKNWPKEITGWYYMPMKATAMGVNGIPDFICCWDSKFIAIEAKAPGKRGDVSANQENRINEIRLAKGLAIVVDDVSQLEELLTR